MDQPTTNPAQHHRHKHGKTRFLVRTHKHSLSSPNLSRKFFFTPDQTMNIDNTGSSSTRFGTTIHITALDGIVNVNSLFTLAVFIGLAWQPTDPTTTLVTDPTCIPTKKISEDLICFHVYSFSSFLFSSLVALSLKQAIRIAKTSCETRRLMMFSFDMCHINKNALRVGYMVSAVGSVCGCGFLMMALVNVVQMKLGVLGCESSEHSYAAVVPLLIFVPLGLLTYVFFVLFAFTR